MSAAEGLASERPIPDLPSGKGPLLDFDYTERLLAEGYQWPYSREAWNELKSWTTQIRHASDGGVPPTLLEAYLSFLLISGKERWVTDLPDSQRGDHVAVQLVRFKLALHHFGMLTHSDRLVHMAKGEQEWAAWSVAWGMPRLEQMAAPYILPHAQQARTWMLEQATKIQETTLEGDVESEWRKWAPGKPLSQMREHHRIWARPLWQVPLSRLLGKQPEPRWHEQVREARKFWQSVFALSGGDGRYDWLSDLGCVSTADIRCMGTQIHVQLKKCRRLLHHNQDAACKRLHLIPCWPQQGRPRCIACERWGFSSKSWFFLNQECANSEGMDGERIHLLLSDTQASMERWQSRLGDLRHLKSALL